MGEFEGRVVIVTGGAMGIGEAYCRSSAAVGHKPMDSCVTSEGGGSELDGLHADWRPTLRTFVSEPLHDIVH